MSWNWDTWAGWHARSIARRNWRKAAIRRMIEMRDAEATNNGDATDYFAAEAVTERHGMIYGVYQFPTWKWYVVQTVNTIQSRTK